ncbi:hypothetical protein ACFQH9_28820, partial [Pseudonocardia lutea]
MPGCRTERALRRENASLRRLLSLSSALAELREEGEIVARATAAVEALTSCTVVAAPSADGCAAVRSPGGRGPGPGPAARLAQLDGA